MGVSARAKPVHNVRKASSKKHDAHVTWRMIATFYLTFIRFQLTL